MVQLYYNRIELPLQWLYTLQVMTEDLFLGEGSFLTLEPGDESAPIPYCVETGCEVTVDYDISSLKFHRIQSSRKRRQRTISVSRIKPRVLLNHQFMQKD